MKTPSTQVLGLLNALGTTAYIFAISQFMRNAQYIFPKKDNALTPVAVLLLFVISAAITGGLVLGRPLLWYLDGKKSEAVRLFLFTVAWLAIIMIIVFAALLLK